jgi:hypothetical protein
LACQKKKFGQVVYANQAIRKFTKKSTYARTINELILTSFHIEGSPKKAKSKGKKQNNRLQFDTNMAGRNSTTSNIRQTMEMTDEIIHTTIHFFS